MSTDSLVCRCSECSGLVESFGFPSYCPICETVGVSWEESG